jgi:LuxR family transcriptional regulator, maltose regulon positive regulatory protein
LAHDDPAVFLREYEHLTLARVLLAQGHLPEAAGLLARLTVASEAAGRMGRVLEALVVLALVQQAQGEAVRAQASLQRALALAGPENYVRVFLDEGAPMLALLAAVPQRGQHRAYAERLLAAGRGPALPASRAPLSGTLPLAAPGLSEALSEREQVVLRLLAAGLSNQDIAQELVVAQSTVHWHVKNIYSKLGVHSRTQAAIAARGLGIVA